MAYGKRVSGDSGVSGVPGSIKRVRELVIHNDSLTMPAKLSGALSQVLMQAMVSGETMEVPRKGQVAINVVRCAPCVIIPVSSTRILPFHTPRFPLFPLDAHGRIATFMQLSVTLD